MKNQKMQELCHKSLLKLKNVSPTILTCVGAVGVVATAILSAKDTKKCYECEEPQQYQFSLKKYIPTAIAGTATIACIFGANTLNQKQIASLIGAYEMLNKSYRNYREAVKELHGQDADSEIMAQIAEKTYIQCDGMSLYSPDDDHGKRKLFYDSFLERYFESTMECVMNAEYHTNRNLQVRGYVPLYEFYDFLGIDNIPDNIRNNDDFGWNLDNMYEDGMSWLDFSNNFKRLSNGKECYVITTTIMPGVIDYEFNTFSK